MGYIFVFNLPAVFVRYLGSAANCAFIRGANRIAYGPKSEDYRAQEGKASSLGPGLEECKTSIASSGNATDMYGSSVLERAKSHGTAFYNMTGLYRDGAGTAPWSKSLETIADLYALETSASNSPSPSRRRSSISNGALFTDPYKGSLKAPTYVLWGEKDQACGRAICLDGLGDYLGKNSEIILLPRTGHWTPVQQNSRTVLAKMINLCAARDAKPVSKMSDEVAKLYEGTILITKK